MPVGWVHQEIDSNTKCRGARINYIQPNAQMRDGGSFVWNISDSILMFVIVRMCVSPQNSCVETWAPMWWGLGGGPLGGEITSQRASLPLLPCEDTVRRLPSGLSPDSESGGDFVLDFPAVWMARNKCLLFISYPVYVILLQQPKQTETTSYFIFRRKPLFFFLKYL